jgi:hypothetical protein
MTFSGDISSSASARLVRCLSKGCSWFRRAISCKCVIYPTLSVSAYWKQVLIMILKHDRQLVKCLKIFKTYLLYIPLNFVFTKHTKNGKRAQKVSKLNYTVRIKSVHFIKNIFDELRRRFIQKLTQLIKFDST